MCLLGASKPTGFGTGGGLWVAHAGPARIPPGWGWAGVPWGAHSQRGWNAKPAWISLLTWPLPVCPWTSDSASHICEIAGDCPPHGGWGYCTRQQHFCSGPDLCTCPRGIDLIHFPPPGTVPGRGQLPQRTGLWRCSRCSAAPSSWLHRAWAQSENLSRQFCHLPGRGLRSSPVCSGPAQWWAPVGTSWLGKQSAHSRCHFFKRSKYQRQPQPNTGPGHCTADLRASGSQEPGSRQEWLGATA